jgi:hypothetical protein
LLLKQKHTPHEPTPPLWKKKRTRRGLAADRDDARRRLLALLGAHLLELLVAPDDAEHVEQLALVLVDALDLFGFCCVGFRVVCSGLWFFFLGGN